MGVQVVARIPTGAERRAEPAAPRPRRDHALRTGDDRGPGMGEGARAMMLVLAVAAAIVAAQAAGAGTTTAPAPAPPSAAAADGPKSSDPEFQRSQG